MNLSPYPHADDLVFIENYEVRTASPGTVSTAAIVSATFQGNDRPALTAYGASEEQAVACLYNALTVEYELEREL